MLNAFLASELGFDLNLYSQAIEKRTNSRQFNGGSNFINPENGYLVNMFSISRVKI